MLILKKFYIKVIITLNMLILSFVNYFDIKAPDKFWLHRTNSVQKAQELSYKYSGIEIDVNYNLEKEYYDVTHDIPDSIGLNLKDILITLKDNKKIWIDYKNLDSHNSLPSLLVMNKILKETNLEKNQLIIESSNYNELRNFKKDGYYTSYYVPYLKLDKMTDIEKETEKKKLIEIKNTGNIDAFSFPSYLYPFIKEIEVGNLDLLTWQNNNHWTEFYTNRDFYRMLKDSNIKVILTKEYSKHNR